MSLTRKGLIPELIQQNTLSGCATVPVRGLALALRGLALGVGLALMGSVARGAVAANDAFASRTVLTGTQATSTASMTGATHEPDEPNPHGVSPGASLWWEWTAPFTGGVALTASGNAVNGILPKVSVFTGTALTNLELVFKAYGGVSATESGFRVNAGTTYLFALDAVGQPIGDVTLNLAPGPENDDFRSRTSLQGDSVEGESVLHGATLEEGEPVHGALVEQGSVWWEWTAPATRNVSVHAEAMYSIVAVVVYTGDSLDKLTRVAMDRDGDGWSAQVSFHAETGQTFIIAVAGWNGASPVLVRIRPAPQNDDFAHRTSLGPGAAAVEATTLGALGEPGEPTFGVSSKTNSVWYEWQADHDGGHELRLTGGGATAVLAAGDALTNLVARVSVQVASAGVGSVNFRATAGEKLILRINGLLDGGAPFHLEIIPGPGNDDFGHRWPIAALNENLISTSVGATREPGEPATSGGRTVWWSWTAPKTGGYYAETADTNGAPFLGVYRGATLEELTPVAADTIWTQMPLLRRSFHAIAGETFAFVIADEGQLGRPVNLTLFASPGNDDFGGAVRLEGVGDPVTGTALGATAEPGQPALPSGWTAPVWYRWRAPVTGPFAVRVYDPDPEAGVGVAIFRGDTLASLSEVVRCEFRWGESVAGFQAQAGVDYAIAVAGREAFNLQILPTAANDDLATATSLAGLALTNTVTAFLASREPGEPAVGALTNAGSLWWRWQAPETRGYEVEALHAYGRSALGVYTGATPGGLQPVLPVTETVGNFNRVHFHATAGTEYAIGLWVVAGSESATLALRPGPVNDDFAGRILLVGATASNSISFHGASHEPGEPLLPGCENSGSVWYEWKAPSTGPISIRSWVTGATNLAVAVWQATSWPPVELLASSGPSSGGQAKVAFHATEGSTYWVAVLANAQDTDRTLIIQMLAGPRNDDFAERELLEGEIAVAAGTTLGATTEPDEVVTWEGASTWYRWVAPRDGHWVASLIGASSHVVRVFTGTTLTSLMPMGTSYWSRAEFSATAQVEYQIGVFTTADATYAYTLRLAPPPVNDAYPNRTLLIGTNLTASSYTLHSTTEPREWFDGGSLGSVWWTWVAPGHGLARFTLRTTELAGPAFAAFSRLPDTLESNVVAAVSGWTTNELVGSFPVLPGRIYDLRASTIARESTNLVLGLSFEPRPALAIDWINQGTNWFPGGREPWFVQTNIVRSGLDAVQSGHIPPPAPGAYDTSTTWLQASFAGPGTLEFWWKVSSAPTDKLTFTLPSEPSRPPSGAWTRSGNVDWTRLSVDLNRRTNVVRWAYSKTSSRISGMDAAFLDDVRFVPRPPLDFSLGVVPASEPGRIGIRFTAEAQRLFTLETTVDFREWLVITNVANLGTASQVITITPLPAPTESAQFFRVRAE